MRQVGPAAPDRHCFTATDRSASQRRSCTGRMPCTADVVFGPVAAAVAACCCVPHAGIETFLHAGVLRPCTTAEARALPATRPLPTTSCHSRPLSCSPALQTMTKEQKDELASAEKTLAWLQASRACGRGHARRARLSLAGWLPPIQGAGWGPAVQAGFRCSEGEGSLRSAVWRAAALPAGHISSAACLPWALRVGRADMGPLVSQPRRQFSTVPTPPWALQEGKDIRFGDWTAADVAWLNSVNVRGLPGAGHRTGTQPAGQSRARRTPFSSSCSRLRLHRSHLPSPCLYQGLADGMHAPPPHASLAAPGAAPVSHSCPHPRTP